MFVKQKSGGFGLKMLGKVAGVVGTELLPSD